MSNPLDHLSPPSVPSISFDLGLQSLAHLALSLAIVHPFRLGIAEVTRQSERGTIFAIRTNLIAFFVAHATNPTTSVVSHCL
jgi:hypothetical protein